jgi:hypothetical protein
MADFGPDVAQRTATFSDKEFHVGLCRNASASVTINADGTVQWRIPGPNLLVRLIFIDRNNQRLFQMPFITFNRLPNAGVTWRRTDLAIPEHLFPFITPVSETIAATTDRAGVSSLAADDQSLKGP